MKYKVTLNDDVSLIIDAEKEVDAVRRAKEIKSKMGLGKVSDSSPDKLTDAFERKDFGDIHVVEHSGEIQIGWAALGTVSVSEAEKFLKDLQKAITYAKSHK